MEFEAVTDRWLRCLLGRCDGQDARVFLEVGLGGGDWSFEWATVRGWRCVAVEPVPNEKLRTRCLTKGVDLIEAAVCGNDGSVLLFEGEFGGSRLDDTNSIRSDWWGVGGKSREVPAVSLPTLVQSWGDSPLLCIKVDVEGAEQQVLSGLTDLAAAKRPRVVSFEYGGGGLMQNGEGGWSPQFLSGTLGCLKLLKESGYSHGVILERRSWAPRFFRLSDFSGDASDLFLKGDEVGNIIAWSFELKGLRKSMCLLDHHARQMLFVLKSIMKRPFQWGRHKWIQVKHRL